MMNQAAEQTPRRRVVREGPERREEILDAATELFAEQGYSDCVTQALAERLRVGKGTIYRYFPSKQELFLAAVDRAMSRLHEHLAARVAPISDPLERIRRGVFEFLAFFDQHPRYVELFMQERAQFRDRKTPTFIAHRERNIYRWTDVYRSLIAEGRVRDIPPERITDVVGELLYGAIFMNYFSGRRKPVSEQAGDILEIVFSGIFTDAERERQAAARPPGAGGPPAALN
jgi:AcrR family transcriptional regulator